MSAASLARQLGAMRQGTNWRAPCPCGCGYNLSFSEGEGGKLLVFCFGGHEYSEILPALVEYGLLDDDDGDDSHASRRVIVCPRDDAERIAQARQIYTNGVEDERVAAYLRFRGISLNSPILRFGEQAPHRLGARMPAMLAPVVNVDGEQIGVHMTYLRRDGGGKADLPKEYRRECRESSVAARSASRNTTRMRRSSSGKASKARYPQCRFLASPAGQRFSPAGSRAWSFRPTCAGSSSLQTTMALGSATPWRRMTDGPPRGARCGSRPHP